MIGAYPIGAPLKRCHQDQRQCLTIQRNSDGTAELYDDAVEGGIRLRFPAVEVRKFVRFTAAANPGYNEEDAARGRYFTLANTRRIIAMYSPITDNWIISDRDNPELELPVSLADGRMFVVGTLDGTFAEITDKAQLVT